MGNFPFCLRVGYSKKGRHLIRINQSGVCVGYIQVDESRVAIKERFGKFERVVEPGCHCVPYFLGSKVVIGLGLRVVQLDVRCETKTKDNVFVNIVAAIQFCVMADKAKDAIYMLDRKRIPQIQAYVFAGLPKKLAKSWTKTQIAKIGGIKSETTS